MLLQPFIRCTQVSLLITSLLVAAACRARQYLLTGTFSPRARQCYYAFGNRPVFSVPHRARAHARSRTMRRESRSALLLWALASARAQTGSITLVESDKAFEHEVMGGDVCRRVQEAGPGW